MSGISAGTGNYSLIRGLLNVWLNVGLLPAEKRKYTKKFQEPSEIASTWIWYSYTHIKPMCHDVGAFVSAGVGVGEWQSEDSFVCFGAKSTQRACVRDFLRDRKKTRDGKVREQWKEESSQFLTVRKRRPLTEELGPVVSEARSADARGWVCVPGSCVGISLGYTRVIAHRKTTESVANFSLPALRANPSPCLFILLFVHLLSMSCLVCL